MNIKNDRKAYLIVFSFVTIGLVGASIAFWSTAPYREVERLLDEAVKILEASELDGVNDISELRKIANLPDEVSLDHILDDFVLRVNTKYELKFGRNSGYNIVKVLR